MSAQKQKVKSYSFRLKPWQRAYIEEIVADRAKKGEEVSRMQIITEIFERGKLDWEYTKYQRSLSNIEFPPKTQENQLETREETPPELVSTEEE